jgi:hypothetical protein
VATYVFRHYRRTQPSISTTGQLIAKHDFEAAGDIEADNFARANFMGDFDAKTDFSDVRDSQDKLVMSEGLNA